MDMDKTIEEVRLYARNALKIPRFEHCERTAQTALYLCKRFGLDEKKGFLAGIAHDMCKEAPERLVISLSERDGKPISALEQSKPSLLHGRAAAMLLACDFAVSDDDILDAVRYHTFGNDHMIPLACVLYVADKIEPGRDYLQKNFRSKIEKMSLIDMCLAVIDITVLSLKEKGRDVSHLTELFKKELQREKKTH